MGRAFYCKFPGGFTFAYVNPKKLGRIVASFSQDNRQVVVHTPLADDQLLLQRLVGREALSEPFEYSLTLLSKNRSITGDEIVGKQLTVEYKSEDGRSRYFHGFVKRFGYLAQGDEAAVYEAVVVPWLWFLKNRQDCRIFQEMNAPDIIKQVFSDLGFLDFKFGLEEAHVKREYCVQYRETDFNFVSRLMEEEGIFYFFKHENGRHVMHLCDSISGYYKLQDNELEFDKGQGQFAQLTNWRHVYEFRPGKVAQKDYNFKTPTDELLTKKESKIKFEESPKFEIFEYPGLYEESGTGEHLTQIRLQELEAEHDFVEGESTYLSMAPSGRFTVKDHVRESDVGKSFVITEVRLEINSNIGQDTGGGVDFQNSFRSIPAETVFRPERRTKKPVVEGPQTAMIVTDGQEIIVDEHARVKVQFHWDRYGKRNIRSSCWIRVCQTHAGKGWGMIDIPRRDEEVVVSFIEGDPDRPVITGRLYNGKNQPPYSLKGAGDNTKNKTRRGNTTRTVGGSGYNEMTMDDTPGKEQIRIHGQYDMATTVEHDDTQTINNNRTITVHGTHTETIDGDTTITVTKGALNHKIAANKAAYHVEGPIAETYNATQDTTVKNNITIKSTAGEITIDAANVITLVTGSSKLVMKKNGDIDLTGVNIVVNGSATVTTKGNIVHSYAQAQNETKGAIVLSEGSATNTVKGGMVMLNP